jgi:TolB-like protein
MKYFLLGILLFNCCIFLSCSSQKSLVREEVIKVEPNSHEAVLQMLTDQIIVSLSEKKKAKIAIIEFTDLQGNINDFGRYLSEELITRLFLTNKFEVIERHMLNKVLKEHELTLSGLIDVSSAQELGRLLGVDAIASGSISDLGNTVKVNARLISTETGEVFSVASVTFLKDDVVTKLMNNSKQQENFKIQDNRIQSKEDNGNIIYPILNRKQFSIKLLSCYREDRTVICDLSMTNNSEDDIDIWMALRETKFFDQSGNEYLVSIAHIANSSSLRGWYKLEKQIVAGTTVPIQLIFEDVASSSSTVSLLNLKFGNELGEMKFRDFPIIFK